MFNSSLSITRNIVCSINRKSGVNKFSSSFDSFGHTFHIAKIVSERIIRLLTIPQKFGIVVDALGSCIFQTSSGTVQRNTSSLEALA